MEAFKNQLIKLNLCWVAVEWDDTQVGEIIASKKFGFSDRSRLARMSRVDIWNRINKYETQKNKTNSSSSLSSAVSCELWAWEE